MADVELRKLASDGDSLNAPIPAGSVASWLESSGGKVVEKARLSDGRVVTVNEAAEQAQADWNEVSSSSKSFILNKPALAAVATTGSYRDLTDQSELAVASEVDGKLAKKIEDPDLTATSHSKFLYKNSSGKYVWLSQEEAQSNIKFDGTTIAKVGDTYAVNEIPTGKVTGLDGQLAAKLEQSDISGLQNEEQVNALIAAKLVSVVRFRGVKNAVSELDASSSEVGDLWIVKSSRSAESGNVFDEYVCVEEAGSGGAKAKRFELIGSIDSEAFGKLSEDLGRKQDAIDADHPLPAASVSGLSKVATTGAYGDLTGAPEIGDGKVTVRQDGVEVGSFTLNQGVAAEVNVVLQGRAVEPLVSAPALSEANVGRVFQLTGASSGGLEHGRTYAVSGSAGSFSYEEVSGAGGMVSEKLTGDATAEFGHHYVCLNRTSSVITLPKGEEGRRIDVSCQALDEGAAVRINPAQGDTVSGSDHLSMNASYSSVELVYSGSDWKATTPFVPTSSGRFTSESLYGQSVEVLDAEPAAFEAKDEGRVFMYAAPGSSKYKEKAFYKVVPTEAGYDAVEYIGPNNPGPWPVPGHDVINDITVMKNDITVMKNDITAMKNDIDDKYADFIGKYNQFQDDLADVRRIKADMMAAKGEFDRDYAKFVSDYAAFQESYGKFNADKADFDAKKADFDAKKTDFDAKKTDFDGKKTDFDTKYAEMKMLKSGFDQDLAAFNADKADFDGKYSSFDKNYQQFDKNYQQFDKNYQQFDKNYQQFDKNYQQFDKNYQSFDTRYQSFDKNYQSFVNDYGKFNLDYGKFNLDYGNFNSKYDSFVNQYDDFSGKLKIFQNSYDTFITNYNVFTTNYNVFTTNYNLFNTNYNTFVEKFSQVESYLVEAREIKAYVTDIYNKLKDLKFGGDGNHSFKVSGGSCTGGTVLTPLGNFSCSSVTVPNSSSVWVSITKGGATLSTGYTPSFYADNGATINWPIATVDGKGVPTYRHLGDIMITSLPPAWVEGYSAGGEQTRDMSYGREVYREYQKCKKEN